MAGWSPECSASSRDSHSLASSILQSGWDPQSSPGNSDLSEKLLAHRQFTDLDAIVIELPRDSFPSVVQIKQISKRIMLTYL